MSKPTVGSDTPQASVPEGSLAHAWRALRHRNFQLFVFGQSISLIGTWMTRLATSWLVYHLTHSALLLGIVSFAGQILTFALSPFAGVWVERLDRRRLLLWTQVAAALQSLALAALTLAHVITLREIIALTALQVSSMRSTCPAASLSWYRWWSIAATSVTPSPSTPPWPMEGG
jgi:MFS family permease